MTDEERQRTMDFILEQQARMDGHVAELQEYRKHNEPQWDAFQRSFVQLVELTRIMDERMDHGDLRVTALEVRSDVLETRSAAFEAAMARLAVAQAEADEKVSALAAAGVRTDEQIKELAASGARTDEQMRELAVAQAHADERVGALIDMILESRNGPS